MEEECFWVNAEEDNKAESKMAEFKMAAIIKLSQNEMMEEFKMSAIIKLIRWQN